MEISAYELALLEHWDCCKGPCASNFDERNDPIVSSDVGLIGPEIGNVDDLFGLQHTIKRDSRTVTQVDFGIARPVFDVVLLAIDRDGSKDGALAQEQIAERGFTDASRIRQHGIEDGLKIAV